MKKMNTLNKVIHIFCLASLFSLCAPQAAWAALDIEITKGVTKAIPIAIVPFNYSQGMQLPVDVTTIIHNDLANSGRFNVLDENKVKQQTLDSVDTTYWQKQGIDDLVLGNVTPVGHGQYKVDFYLMDMFNRQGNPLTPANQQHVLAKQSYTVKEAELRPLAHHISDMIYQQLTGEKGIFSTRLAYVLVQRTPGKPPIYKLEVADVDGYNPQAILTSNAPIMSPAWSPNGKQIAYVSFEHHRAQIFVSDVATGQRQRITHYPGINGAPAWSPDGKKLAFVLSKDGSPNIYIKDLRSSKLQQVTFDWSIDTEPSWAPDGRSLLFTSDRGGHPQIYSVDLHNHKQQRMTYVGNYNARASYTPDAKEIVMLHRESGVFSIAIQDLASGAVRIITQSGRDESPSVAPNGRMVAFASNYGQRSVLGIASTDGNVDMRLPDQQGDVQEPAWSPYSQ